MNLSQAADFASLRVRETAVPKKESTALDVAKYVFAQGEEKHDPFIYMEPEDWKKKWLQSAKFVLLSMPITCAALVTEPRDSDWVLTRIHAKASHPIVVDVNKNNVGQKHIGYVPPIMVLDGKHRFKAAALRGESHILAWVGCEAVKLIEEQLESKKGPSRATQSIAASTSFEHQTKLSVEAGGPGSGRHASEQTLQKNGWSKSGSTFNHPSGRYYAQVSSNRWSIYDKQGKGDKTNAAGHALVDSGKHGDGTGQGTLHNWSKTL